MLRRILLAVAIVLSAASVWSQSKFVSSLKTKAAKEVTLTGIVECDGTPLKGVVVSDGELVTMTDRNGVYYLKSRKPEGVVFISIPSGYEASRTDMIPEFWAKLEKPQNELERHDFSLHKQSQERYALVAFTDPHLHGKKHDLATFADYVDVVTAHCDSLKSLGTPVYSICMGDIGYNDYWYETGIDLPYTRRYFAQQNWAAPLFTLPGNHDYDGKAVAGDSTHFVASRPYVETYGPRYYSFNIGKEHYVVLENINFKNTPVNESKLEGILGKLDYTEEFNAEELDWLEKDLANISPETHIVVAMHSPVFKEDKISGIAELNLKRESTQRFLDILKPYGKVTFLSGHTHRQRRLDVPTDRGNITDHNLQSTCGAIWWNSSLKDANIAFDGNAVGFKLFEIEGDSVSWRFVPYEFPIEKQFKIWDTDKLRKTISWDAEVAAFRRHYPKWSEYENLPEGSLLVQIWDYDPQGKLEAKAEDEELRIEEVYEIHPDYYLNTAVPMSEWSGDYKKTFLNPRRARMFVIHPSAESRQLPVSISWTDRFGRKYSEEFKRM